MRASLIILIVAIAAGLGAAGEPPSPPAPPSPPSPSSSKSFQVYRAVQFDVIDDKYGSRVSTMELKASANPGIMQPKLSKNGKKKKKFPPLNRKCVVVTMKEATKELLAHLVDARRVGGLLIVVPKDSSKVSKDTLKNWETLEEWIRSHELKVPIFFTEESAHASRIVDFVQTSSSAKSSDDYLLKVNTRASKKIQTPTLQNVQGWIAGESKDVDSEHLPTIAVVGHYDSFGVVPGLAKDSGTSAVAVLELARMFAKAYKKQKGEYNLLFVLTAGGHMNFAGARDWLEMLDVQLMDSIDFVVCLDDLSTSNALHLHYSKNPQDTTMKRISTAFETASSTNGAKLTLHRKKIQLKNPHLAWQHEQFAMKRIVGVTLSSHATPAKLFARSSHFQKTIKPKDFSQLISTVADAIASFVYPPNTVVEEIEVEEEAEIEVEEQVEVEVEGEDDATSEEKNTGKKNKKNKKNKKKMKTVTRTVKKKIKKMIKKQVKKETQNDISLKVDATYISTWSRYMRQRARVGPFMSADNAADLEKALRSSVKETSLQKFVLEQSGVTNFVFYDNSEGTMSAYLVKGIEFDLKMTLLTFAYLGSLWLYIVVLKEGWAGARSKLPLSIRKFVPKGQQQKK